MEQQIRRIARRYLPDGLRRALGTLSGKFHERVILPALGLIFDLRGGRFHASGCTFIIPKDVTTRSFRSCFLLGTYEQYERELLPKFIRPGDAVLELGACLGVVSCITNRLLTDKSRHTVVEGNPLCIPALRKNRELNGCAFHVEACAVDSKPEVTFYLHPHFVVGGSLQRATLKPVQVPAKSLSDLEREHGPFTALLIDIEGSEREVFEESAQSLKNYRLVVAELHEWAIGPAGVERCRQILRDSGLQCAERAGIVEVWLRA
jgi:FkbM family methyltransferase